jgi:hypothetical protein
MSPPTDRRRAPRYPANLQSRCVPLGNEFVDKPWPGRVEDISAGGMKLNVCRRFECGTRLIVELENPEEKFSRTVIVTVVHVKANPAGGWYLGCAIDGELDQRTVDLLRLKTEEPAERAWMRLSSTISTTCYVIGSANGPLRRVRVENVSKGGIGLETAQEVPEGACLEVQVPNARSSLHRVLARVIRVTPQENQRWVVGCAFFTELSERELEAFVNPNPPVDIFRLEKDYTLLFNAKDLTGWELGFPPQDAKPNEEKLHGKWASRQRAFEVAGEMLVATGKAIRAVYTAQDYNAAFHLKLECRPPADSKNGTCHCCLLLRSVAVRIDCNAGSTSSNGSPNTLHMKPGEWNDLEVTVRPAVVSNIVNGRTLTADDVLGVFLTKGRPTATLNGQPIQLSSFQHSSSAEAICKWKGLPIGPPLKIPATGALGFQAGTGRFEFRRIRIKEMP